MHFDSFVFRFGHLVQVSIDIIKVNADHVSPNHVEVLIEDIIINLGQKAKRINAVIHVQVFAKSDITLTIASGPVSITFIASFIQDFSDCVGSAPGRITLFPEERFHPGLQLVLLESFELSAGFNIDSRVKYHCSAHHSEILNNAHTTHSEEEKNVGFSSLGF